MKLLKHRQLLGLMLLLVMLLVATGTAAAQDTAEVGFFENLEVQPDQSFEVPVSVRNVTDLYAIDIEIRFDPAVLQVEDASPNQDGIQVALGTFLDAGLILFNQADNQEGTIRFAMTQVNPSEPKSGEGVVLVLYFSAQSEGESPLEVSFAEASTRLGEAIALEGSDGLVTVSGGAAPIQATQIPVQDVGQVTVIPTLAPSATPTITPTFVDTPTPAATATQVPGDLVEGSSQEQMPTAMGSDKQAQNTQTEDQAEQGRSILDYWWVVLIVVLAAGGLAAYLLLSKKKS